MPVEITAIVLTVVFPVFLLLAPLLLGVLEERVLADTGSGRQPAARAGRAAGPGVP